MSLEQTISSSFTQARADSRNGSTRLSNPIPDLRKGMAQGNKVTGGFNNFHGRTQGPMGELAKSANRDKLSQLRYTDGMDEEIFTTEPVANTKHYHNRLVKPLAPDLATISRGELGFMHIDNKKSHRVVQLEEMQLQANPRIVVSPSQWNAIAVEHQLRLYHDDPEAFAQLTPRDLYKDWSFEGVVEIDGGAGNDIRTQSMSNKACTMNSKGQVMIHPYWKHVMAGSKCYVVIKRYDFKPNFVLNTKYSGHGFSGRRTLVTKDDVPIRPIQIGFYSLVEGGSLPMEIYQSEDQDGYVFSDALVMFIGTVLRTPDGVTTFDNSFVSHDNGNMDHGHAYVDSNENLSRANLTLMTLIMDCDEGAMPY
jgi:hypothetical protein